ncbi:MAG: glutamine amidotransferase [Myxococcota bacterium]
MHAVVIQHEQHEDLGLLGAALAQEGFSVKRRFRGVEHSDLDAELVVVLGGPMGVYERDLHPFLGDEVAFLSERLALERPCLGICLGAQLMAAAAGAEVFPGKNGFEVGVAPVRLTADAQKDPVLSGLGAKLLVAHWHGDTHAPVPGATLLASTDRYTQQGFRLGNSYAFQFHPELTADEFSRWLDAGAGELTAKGKDVKELKAQLGKLRAAEALLKDFAARLAHHFAKVARG